MISLTVRKITMDTHFYAVGQLKDFGLSSSNKTLHGWVIVQIQPLFGLS